MGNIRWIYHNKCYTTMTKRRFFVVLYFSTIGIVSAFLIYKLIESIDQEKMKADVGSVLPDFTLYGMDQRPFSLAIAEQPTIMVFFNSTCDNCIYEAQVIKENISLFRDASILMLSTEAFPSIQQFSEQTGLIGYHNITFARIDMNDQERAFGQISFPFILVYGADNRLLRKFTGTIHPEEILHYLNER